MPPSPRHSGRASNTFWRSGFWVLCCLALLATVSYLAMPSMLLVDTYEPTKQAIGEGSLNGEAKEGKLAVQCELGKIESQPRLCLHAVPKLDF